MLKDLFFGRLAPWERQRPCGAGYTQKMERAEDLLRYFAGALSAEDYALLELLRDLYSELAAEDECAAFCSGFAMGATIMREIGDEAPGLSHPPAR